MMKQNPNATIVERRTLKAFLYLMLCLMMTLPSQVVAQLLYNQFSYPNGDLTSVSSGVWAAHSGAGNHPIQTSSGQVVITHASGSREDVNTTFATQNSGTLFYSFDFSVDDLGSPYAGVNHQTFAHLRIGSFIAQVAIVPPMSGGDYSISISNSAVSDQVWTTDLLFATTYKLVVRYDFATGHSTLWINPSDEASTNITTSVAGSAASINAFSLRQADSSEDETIRIDNLRIGTYFKAVTGAFITTWKTDNVGTSSNTQILIPLESSTSYSFQIDWGDGTTDTYTGLGSSLNPIHDYGSGNEGTYNITITGTFPHI